MKFAMYNQKLVNAKDAKGHLLYKCPFCGRRMVCHQPKGTRAAYFSHVLSASGFDNPGETTEHIKGKLQLANFFKSSTNKVVIEHYLPKINQWPDLMVNNKVIEFQCSPISTKKLVSRISGYSKMNLKSWWILGSPYQKRHLRSIYIAKFLNYSINLGFFIFFWGVKYNGLIIHYGISECGGRLIYYVRRIYNLKALKNFLQHNQLKLRITSQKIIRKLIASEITINQKRLFYGDCTLMKLQQIVSQEHNSLLGCPMICHFPAYSFPIFNKRVLFWRILIILLIHQTSNLYDVYRQANKYLCLPLTFCQIKNYKFLYKRAFIKYILLLEKHHYVKVDFKDKKITKLKEPRWFSSYYDKLKFLRKYY